MWRFIILVLLGVLVFVVSALIGGVPTEGADSSVPHQEESFEERFHRLAQEHDFFFLLVDQSYHLLDKERIPYLMLLESVGGNRLLFPTI